MSTGVLITLIICATILLLVGIILIVAAIMNRKNKDKLDKTLEVIKSFRDLED